MTLSKDYPDSYDQILSEIESRIGIGQSRLDELAEGVATSLELLKRSRQKLSHEDHGVIRSFEMLFVEAMHVNVWLYHTRNDHDSARSALRVTRRIHELAVEALHTD